MLRRGGAAARPHAKTGTKNYPPCATVPASVADLKPAQSPGPSNPKNHARTTRFARVLRCRELVGGGAAHYELGNRNTGRIAPWQAASASAEPPFNGSTDLASSHLLGCLH